ncbi:hypothetical protein EVAR_102371_1 [Eumeta japonica]|uniref:Uncharacterized protein n=1 Tax=Eumeta variegata TaxID=151549 RepID=A0A4C2A9L2_EUMVA|nr:hypothetical protein EVAR_102371_1 [Eumeta japonica]
MRSPGRRPVHLSRRRSTPYYLPIAVTESQALMTMEQTLMTVTPKQKDPESPAVRCSCVLSAQPHDGGGSAGAAGGALQWKRTAIIPGDREDASRRQTRGTTVYAAGPCRCQK